MKDIWIYEDKKDLSSYLIIKMCEIVKDTDA